MTDPHVSIVTTVYNRVDCLARCLAATAKTAYPSYEQIVVSDAPDPAIGEQIAALCAPHWPTVRYVARTTRANDWGMTPAHDGFLIARGDYVCFLSDDNAFMPMHLDPLVAALDADPALGFAYSSCQYAGRVVLKHSPPRFAAIDLGQPLFRRSVLPAEWPWHELAWDWLLIQSLMARGVTWRHINQATFIFRLERYPDLMLALA